MNIIGLYTDSKGEYSFLYDGSNWNALEVPGAQSTWVSGIAGEHIVGSYVDDDGKSHGFIYTIPEPTTISFLALGAILARRKRRT